MTAEVEQLELESANDPLFDLSRCKTMPPIASNFAPGFTRNPTSLGSNAATLGGLQRLKHARDSAEKAIKSRKIFSVLGPYPIIRESMRKRGWIEKFQHLDGGDAAIRKSNAKGKQQRKSISVGGEASDSNAAAAAAAAAAADEDDDDAGYDDDGDADANEYEDKVPPWEEEGGYYGVLSRIVRNSTPTFLFTLRRDMVDVKALKKDQMLNHFGKAGSFTTKVGLCTTLRSLPWYNDADPNTFYPRCYRLSHDDEKQDFIDDYRLTACISILKWVSQGTDTAKLQQQELAAAAESRNQTENESSQAVATETEAAAAATTPAATAIVPPTTATPRTRRPRTSRAVKPVPVKTIEFALARCKQFLQCCNHDDIDKQEIVEPAPSQWDEFLQWFYAVAHDGALIQQEESFAAEAQQLLSDLAPHWPQIEMDGEHNVWIVKPGALSRGRGVICYHKLEDMLSLVSSSIKKDSKYVVQKYIEKPLLVHNTKFDIRQWFLVTDWNPLTIWFYKRCYLRFSSQEFTLKSLDESIHLCNNSIQTKYDFGKRNPNVPDELMWTSEEFQDYLTKQGKGDQWYKHVYPAMKQAIIYSLMCSLDIIEPRKSEFELYGADFMLTEDLCPWLIEINSSPCMAPSTKITAEMCPAVLEDVVKVVVDRKTDRNCDIGDFELACRLSPVTVPQYLGINLTVEGQGVKKPFGLSQSFDTTLNNNSNAGNNRTAVKPAPIATLHLSHDADSSQESDRSDGVAGNSKQQSDNDRNAAGSSKTTKKLTTYKFVGKSLMSATDNSNSSSRDTNNAISEKKRAKKKSSKESATLRQVPKAQGYLLVESGNTKSALASADTKPTANLDATLRHSSLASTSQVMMSSSHSAPVNHSQLRNDWSDDVTRRTRLTALSRNEDHDNDSVDQSTTEQQANVIVDRVTTAPTSELETVARLQLSDTMPTLGRAKLPTKPMPQAYHQSYTFRRRRGHSGKLILRYTDAGIKKPQIAFSVNPMGQESFPQVVSRYLQKQTHARPKPISIDKPSISKLSIVTHAFFT